MAQAFTDNPSKFTFQREEDGSLSATSAVYQALGAASTCWTLPPRGIFKSEEAAEIAEALFGELGIGR